MPTMQYYVECGGDNQGSLNWMDLLILEGDYLAHALVLSTYPAEKCACGMVIRAKASATRKRPYIAQSAMNMVLFLSWPSLPPLSALACLLRGL